MSSFTRVVIFLHRWLGVAFCLMFLLWFPSGIGMMYWDFPAVTPADRLEHSPALSGEAIRVSPEEAYAAVGASQPLVLARLNTFDGRPVYRFRTGRGDTIVYADTGERQEAVPADAMPRIASRWSGRAAASATAARVDVDQWTVQGSFRALQPLWKYAWPEGEQVYVSQKTGDVVQFTTNASRLGAYLGPIPHWFYFTPLRKHQSAWSRVVIWTSGAATVAALLGLVVGLTMYSPRKRYRTAAGMTSIPYRGQKRWHTILGLIAGVGAATWAFSGMLSMDPFASIEQRPPRTGGVTQAMRGPLTLSAFAAKPPRRALDELAPLDVRELELLSLSGRAMYLATLAGGQTRVVPLDAPPRTEFDRDLVADVVRNAGGAAGVAELRTIDRYDRYYLDRRRQKPLPVMLARMDDAAGTRYYIDPKTARVVGSYSARDRVSRWLYHGLHSLDFPWLYDHRPLWDIVVIASMLAGTALSVTAAILAWRVLAPVGRQESVRT